MELWNELRTAMVVARLGTVSAASSELGVHRATVMRHVDILEEAFGSKLFLRHSRGYTLTEAGEEMLEIAGRAENMFTVLQARSRQRAVDVSGELIVTSLADLSPLIMQAIGTFRQLHPEIKLNYIADDRLVRLEHAEAHIAIRAGAKPNMEDYIVRSFRRVRFGLYGHKSRFQLANGDKPHRLNDLEFIAPTDDDLHQPFARFMRQMDFDPKTALFVNDQRTVLHAVLAGIGVGFLAEHIAHPFRELTPILPPSDDSSVPLWIATHMDLRHVSKIQKFLQYINQYRATSVPELVDLNT
ncbi:MAG: LysR family transcriptional regulator [Pseudomonadota bacterium]